MPLEIFNFDILVIFAHCNKIILLTKKRNWSVQCQSGFFLVYDIDNSTFLSLQHLPSSRGTFAELLCLHTHIRHMIRGTVDALPGLTKGDASHLFSFSLPDVWIMCIVNKHSPTHMPVVRNLFLVLPPKHGSQATLRRRLASRFHLNIIPRRNWVGCFQTITKMEIFLFFFFDRYFTILLCSHISDILKLKSWSAQHRPSIVPREMHQQF